MCGISGIVSMDAKFISIEKIKQMTNAIKHRGPDDEGQWISNNGNVGFGHRRLSIIDLSAQSKQPMHYEERYTITYNGEIYNYIELKAMLVKYGYKFYTHSDTEVLMALYDFKGEECLSYLDGMFAFAIYDIKKNIIFMARDRFGEKPFHYHYKKGEYFVFGSEMKAIWAIGIEKKVNQEMIFKYLNNNLTYNPEDLSTTFYKDIFRLEHSNYAILNVNDMNLNIKKYWSLNCSVTNNYSESFNDTSEKFREMFMSSVIKRLRSDVPIGSSLSGGLDSSLIVCAINSLNGDKKNAQKTFSARFPGFHKDESYFQNLVIEKTGVNAYFTYPNYENIIKDIDKVLTFQEEPFSSSSIMVQYDVFKLAKASDVKVLLDGQGADEYLAGYHSFYRTLFFELINSGNFIEFYEQKKQYKNLHKNNTINKQEKNELVHYVKSKIPILLSYANKINNKRYSNEFIFNNDFHKTYFKSANYGNDNFSNLNQSLYNSMMKGSMQELLRYADRNSMANSLEVRLPFLDHNLVQFVFNLPSNFKINDGWTKFILRKSFSDILPSQICWRVDKIGYEPPQKNWMENKEIKDILFESKKHLIKEGILNGKLITKTSELSNNLNWNLLLSYKLTV